MSLLFTPVSFSPDLEKHSQGWGLLLPPALHLPHSGTMHFTSWGLPSLKYYLSLLVALEGLELGAHADKQTGVLKARGGGAEEMTVKGF